MAASLANTDLVNFFSSAFLTCQQGVLFQTQQTLSEKPIQWDAPRRIICDLGEVCQETLLLIDVGAWQGKTAGPLSWSPGRLPWIVSPDFPA